MQKQFAGKFVKLDMLCRASPLRGGLARGNTTAKSEMGQDVSTCEN